VTRVIPSTAAWAINIRSKGPDEAAGGGPGRGCGWLGREGRRSAVVRRSCPTSAAGSRTGAAALSFLFTSSHRVATLTAYRFSSISGLTSRASRFGSLTAHTRTCVSSRNWSLIPGLRFIIRQGLPPVVPSNPIVIDIRVMAARAENRRQVRGDGRQQASDGFSSARQENLFSL
jgi:hypothetical protein